jgi:hypothetical protein
MLINVSAITPRPTHRFIPSAASSQAVTPFQDADATLTTCTPALRFLEPAAVFLLFPLGAFRIAIRFREHSRVAVWHLSRGPRRIGYLVVALARFRSRCPGAVIPAASPPVYDRQAVGT